MGLPEQSTPFSRGALDVKLERVTDPVVVAQLAEEAKAQRSNTVDHVAYHLIPPAGIAREAAAFREGERKYSTHNWRKGMPMSEIANHAINHIYQWLAEDDSEDHIGHAKANLSMIAEFEETRPDLDDRWKEKK